MASALRVSLPAGHRPSLSVQVLALPPEVCPRPPLVTGPAVPHAACCQFHVLVPSFPLYDEGSVQILSCLLSELLLCQDSLICPVVGSAAISSPPPPIPLDQTSFLTWPTYLTLYPKALEFGDGAVGPGWGFGRGAGPHPQLWWVPISAPGITSVLLQIKAGLAQWSLPLPPSTEKCLLVLLYLPPQGAQGAKLTRDCRAAPVGPAAVLSVLGGTGFSLAFTVSGRGPRRHTPRPCFSLWVPVCSLQAGFPGTPSSHQFRIISSYPGSNALSSSCPSRLKPQVHILCLNSDRSQFRLDWPLVRLRTALVLCPLMMCFCSERKG